MGVWTANAVVGLIIAILGLRAAWEETDDAIATQLYVVRQGADAIMQQVAGEHVSRAKTFAFLLKWHVVKQSINGSLGGLSFVTFAVDGEIVHVLTALAVPIGLIVASLGTTISSFRILSQLRRDHAVREKLRKQANEVNHT